ncbi:N-acetylmuramoyl-L-alanine amidase family protein [Paenisporosarcina sp. NPDC076898]|uniref:N-acetylmuramoyl-L-alanine amidase family protein n=1 Tax=unclassified Paenisporosarcina TaxID=2642018 RepID=UPI003D00C4A9
MKKVTWSAGHGLTTPGKQTPDGQKEWTFNDKVVRAGMAFLAQFEGVVQLRLDDPSGKLDIPLKERSNQANSWRTNVHVDVHHNAQDSEWNSGSLGIETLAMQGTANYAESLKLAQLVHPKYVSAMGLKDRGIKSANLHMLREIKAPAILTEGGFMDSRVDVAAMRNDELLKTQGEAIALGIAEYLDLKLKTEVKAVSEQKLSTGQQALIDEAKRLKLTDGNDPLGEVNRLYLFSVIVGLAQKVEALEKQLANK